MSAVSAVLYTTVGCPHCEVIRVRLAAAGTVFREIDVSREPQAIPELLKLTRGRRLVPVVVREGRIEIAPDGGSEF